MREIKRGDRVTHKIYGDGYVNNIIPYYDLVWAEVKFDKEIKHRKSLPISGMLTIPVDYFRKIDS